MVGRVLRGWRQYAHHGGAVDARAAVVMGRCAKDAPQRFKAGVSEMRVNGAHASNCEYIVWGGFLKQVSPAAFSSENPIEE